MMSFSKRTARSSDASCWRPKTKAGRRPITQSTSEQGAKLPNFNVARPSFAEMPCAYCITVSFKAIHNGFGSGAGMLARCSLMGLQWTMHWSTAFT